MKLKSRLKFRYLRLRVWYRKKKEHTFNEKELKIYKSVLKILYQPDTEVLFMPISGKIYLKTKDERYIYLISNQRIKFTNHKHFYNDEISEQLTSKLIKIITRKVEKDRLKMENEIFDNELKIMDNIINETN